VTRQRRYLWALAMAGVVAATAAVQVSRDGAVIEGAVPRAELRAISTRLDGPHSTILIESTEPVAYVTSQPDPLTVLVDLRNVKAGQLPPGMLGLLPPVSNVNVEEAVAGDGAQLARVRVSLAHQAKYRVRSSRNVIFVEVDRAVVPSAAVAAAAAVVAPEPAPIPAAAPPADSLAGLAEQRRRANTPPPPARPTAKPGASTPTPQPAPGQPLPVPDAAPAPPAPQGSPAPAPPPTQGAPRFSGHTITLDMQGADLRAVLRTFSDISGLNIVIDPSITGTVDVLLRDVPWDQALDIILKANKLGYSVDGTVVRIAPLNVLAQEEEDRRKLSDARALAGELGVLTMPLSYAKAPDLVPILTRSALSPRGEALLRQSADGGLH